MKTIKNNITNEYNIQKSKFITKIYYVCSEQEITNILNKTKKEYKDATHICYAYIINNTKRFYDDGEPNGTAGMPILNVLEQKELTNVLALVIRYFGGIKLGAGGLIRAYNNSIVNALNNQILGEITSGYRVTITFSYNNSKFIDNIIKNGNIINKEFNNDIKYTFNITVNNYLEIKDKLENNIKSIEKEDIFLVM